jgi:dTDP-4-amino-4,6-dideoxygalactose transaminase
LALGDEVVVPARTYVASASCAVMRGAVPVVADVDRDSQCLTADTISAVLTDKTRAVVVVHLGRLAGGHGSNHGSLARPRPVVIEDCAQAHGAFYKGRPVGSIGHAGAFSFCQDKIITTGGEGGLLALDDEFAWRRAWAFKDIGRSYAAAYEREHPPGFRWLTESFGTNWRMTEMQAALGLIQLTRLQDWSKRRAANADALRAGLQDLPSLRIPAVPTDCWHANYKFYCFVKPECLAPNWNRDRILAEIEAAGVPCGVGSCSEIYLEKAFTDRGWGPGERLPVAKELGETSMMFMVHPTLSESEVQLTARTIREVVQKASIPANELRETATAGDEGSDVPRWLGRMAALLAAPWESRPLSFPWTYWLRGQRCGWHSRCDLKSGICRRVQQLWIYAASPLIFLPVFVRFGLYRAIFRYTGLATMQTLLKAAAVYGAILLGLVLLTFPAGVPRSVGVLQPVLFCCSSAIHAHGQGSGLPKGHGVTAGIAC